MFILNQSPDTIFVEEESENRDGGTIAFHRIDPGTTYSMVPSWVYRIHSYTKGSAIITPLGGSSTIFGNLTVAVRHETVIVT